MNDFSRTFSSLAQELVLPHEVAATIQGFRHTIENILTGKDKRKLLIVGPCSIHRIDAALEYAHRLNELRTQVEESFFIVMRTYMEKSRTALGWSGFLSDPKGDHSCDIQTGIKKTRHFLMELAALKLPAATEFLDPLLHPFYSDLIAWGSIGARTVQSPPHRILGAHLPMPIGFKNRTDGNIDVAIQAIEVASHPHTHLSLSKKGTLEQVKSLGNPFAHLVLRGGETHGNFDRNSSLLAAEKLRAKGLLDAILVDCSHGNSQKKYKNQKVVFESVIQNLHPESSVRGFMLESFLEEGHAPFSPTIYGTSVTDPCLSFHETAALISAHATLEVLL